MNITLVIWALVVLLNAGFVVTNLVIQLMHRFHYRFSKKPYPTVIYPVNNWFGFIGIGISCLIILMPFRIRQIDPTMDWANVVHTVIFGLVGMTICSDSLWLNKPEKRVILDRISNFIFFIYVPYLIYRGYQYFFVVQ